MQALNSGDFSPLAQPPSLFKLHGMHYDPLHHTDMGF